MTLEEREILDDLIERGELSVTPYAVILRNLTRAATDPSRGQAIRCLNAYLKALLEGGDVLAPRQQFLEAVEALEDQEWAEIFLDAVSALDEAFGPRLMEGKL